MWLKFPPKGGTTDCFWEEFKNGSRFGQDF